MTSSEHYSDYKWIKVKKYTMDETLSWEERYKKLEEHHIAETSFMIDEVRKLAAENDKFNDKFNANKLPFKD